MKRWFTFYSIGWIGHLTITVQAFKFVCKSITMYKLQPNFNRPLFTRRLYIHKVSFWKLNTKYAKLRWLLIYSQALHWQRRIVCFDQRLVWLASMWLEQQFNWNSLFSLSHSQFAIDSRSYMGLKFACICLCFQNYSCMYLSEQ